jgi:hypothetical protein
MAVNFVGDNDHGDTVPSTDVLLQMIKTLREDVVHLAYELNEIKEGFEGCCNACEPVGLMNKKLREERDEARREVCRLMSMFNAENSVQIAASRSWDCFKEDGK